MKKKRQSDALEDSSTDSNDERIVHSPNGSGGGCQHIKKSVDTAKLRKTLKATGLASDCVLCLKGGASGVNNENTSCLLNQAIDDTIMMGFEYDTTLWLCLKCGTQLCGRSKNQHALQHYKTPHSDSHALTMNTRSFEIWCYECNNEVSANSRKYLFECVETVRKIAQKQPQCMSPTTLTPSDEIYNRLDAIPLSAVGGNRSSLNVEHKIAQTWEALRPLVPDVEDDKSSMKTVPLPPPPPNAIPGMAKRVNDSFSYGTPLMGMGLQSLNDGPHYSKYEPNTISITQLPRVRGLTNLGNTCFFNAVMQCLAQTPYLLEVLKESAEPGEEFILPGGTFKFKDDEDVYLPKIKGTLNGWGGLTASLANALEELQVGGGVFTPNKLFDKLCNKCPQFRGGDQHDSHELLRHLLESVRSEDLKRYQRVILKSLGYNSEDVNSVSEELKQKCKIYGNQAGDRILRPEQVFRGFLVSTLTCQECYNVSSRHEYFLDMSLPVSMDKPQPPQRRKTSPEHDPLDTFEWNPNRENGPTKSQLKKEKSKERKAKRAAKHHNNKMAQKREFEDVLGAFGDAAVAQNNANEIITNNGLENHTIKKTAGRSASEDEKNNYDCLTTSSEAESDADIEDNLIDDNIVGKTNSLLRTSTGINASASNKDTNGNNQVISPTDPEKRDDSPENRNKDLLEEDENDSGIATSPATTGGNYLPTSNTNNIEAAAPKRNSSIETTNNSILAVGLSQKGVHIMRQLSLGDSTEAVVPTTSAKIAGSNANIETLDDPNTNNDTKLNNKPSIGVTNGIAQLQNDANKDDIEDAIADAEALKIASQLTEKLHLQERKAARMKAKRQRTQSYSDWSTTIAPRYQCEDNECSVQSCLNNFTAVELMTGNNKVGCDECTKRINGDDPKAKTVNTNATKQFLISSPPAVLILHLKRFQLGARCMFRKLTRGVDFPLILDIAPFCGSKVKNLPNINRKQKKLLYALYGIVEHSGSMYGGHYTAYVKVRPKLPSNDKRWSFIPQGSKAELDQDDEQRKKLDELLVKEQELRMKAANDSDDFSNSDSCSTTSSATTTTADSSSSSSSSSSENIESRRRIKLNNGDCRNSGNSVGNDSETANVQVPIGKWYYISDSRVHEVTEDTVLKAQAYLLFYERIH